MSTSYGLNYANPEKSAKTKRRGEKESSMHQSRQTSRGDAAKTGMAKWQKFDRTTPQRLSVPDIIVDAEDEPSQSKLRSGGKFNNMLAMSTSNK